MARTLSGKCIGQAARIEAEDERDNNHRLSIERTNAIAQQLLNLVGVEEYNKLIDAMPNKMPEFEIALKETVDVLQSAAEIVEQRDWLEYNTGADREEEIHFARYGN
jgi:hypothetical protein